MAQGKIFSPQNPFQRHQYVAFYEDIPEADSPSVASFLEVFPKTIVNENNSKYLPFNYSLNPYQGCEHGCSYCYARPTHEYWGLNAGEDFERKILFKKNASQLLEIFLKKKNYAPAPIFLSGNTDCYQPIERKLKITRAVLSVLLRYQNPVSILTKNALVIRDLDILTTLNKKNLVSVTITLNSLDETLRRKMEPRTSSVKNKLKAIEILVQAGIPTYVMVGPVIPGLNCHEILPILQTTAALGVRGAAYSLINLNDNVEPYFVNWIEKTFPDRAEKVLHSIQSMRNGALQSKKFKEKMSGAGKTAELLHNLFRIGRQKYFSQIPKFTLNTTDFCIPNQGKQLSLFEE